MLSLGNKFSSVTAGDTTHIKLMDWRAWYFLTSLIHREIIKSRFLFNIKICWFLLEKEDGKLCEPEKNYRFPAPCSTMRKRLSNVSHKNTNFLNEILHHDLSKFLGRTQMPSGWWRNWVQVSYFLNKLALTVQWHCYPIWVC